MSSSKSPKTLILGVTLPNIMHENPESATEAIVFGVFLIHHQNRASH